MLIFVESVHLMHAVEGSHVVHKIDLECMVTFYKGILNKTYIYILINSLVWREICSVGYLASLSFFKNHILRFLLSFPAALWTASCQACTVFSRCMPSIGMTLHSHAHHFLVLPT